MTQPLMTPDEIGARRVGSHRGGIAQIYVLSDHGRNMILAEYDGTPQVIDDLARRLQVPRHRIKKWGCELGLARKKEPFWTPEDEQYLATYLHRRSLGDIAKTLGRTKVAVVLKAKRLGVNKTQEGYTMRGLCLGLGCDHHKVEIWLKHGWLKGARRHTEREGTCLGDYWLFTDTDIADFIRKHPLEIDQRRMDWLWVIDLLSDPTGHGLGVLVSHTIEEEPKREVLEGEMDIDTEHLLHFDSEALAGKSIALLGITGSGKTNTAFVLLDGLLTNKTAMSIIDIEGEYWQLAATHPELLIVGRSEHCTQEITRGNAVELAKRSIGEEVPILLDLSDYSALEAHGILVKYFGTLWTCSAQAKRPYRIVLEEAHEWLPESGTTDLKDVLSRIALRGRKRGLDMMIISQRSAKVAKDVLTQTSLLFLHKVVHPIDLGVYKQLIPLSGTAVIGMVSGLQNGQAVVVYNHVPQVVRIKRYSTQEVQMDVKTMLRKRVKELEEQLAEKEQLLADQADEIARLTERAGVLV